LLLVVVVEKAALDVVRRQALGVVELDRPQLTPHEEAIEALDRAWARLLELDKAGAITADELPAGVLEAAH
jgi:hypothetical protein